jgi:hypothetical protein
VTYALITVLAVAVGWSWGHATARVDHVLVGATRADDEAALALNDACCERWWTSAGAEHDQTCRTVTRRSTA